MFWKRYEADGWICGVKWGMQFSEGNWTRYQETRRAVNSSDFKLWLHHRLWNLTFYSLRVGKGLKKDENVGDLCAVGSKDIIDWTLYFCALVYCRETFRNEYSKLKKKCPWNETFPLDSTLNRCVVVFTCGVFSDGLHFLKREVIFGSRSSFSERQNSLIASHLSGLVRSKGLGLSPLLCLQQTQMDGVCLFKMLKD